VSSPSIVYAGLPFFYLANINTITQIRFQSSGNIYSQAPFKAAPKENKKASKIARRTGERDTLSKPWPGISATFPHFGLSASAYTFLFLFSIFPLSAQQLTSSLLYLNAGFIITLRGLIASFRFRFFHSVLLLLLLYLYSALVAFCFSISYSDLFLLLSRGGPYSYSPLVGSQLLASFRFVRDLVFKRDQTSFSLSPPFKLPPSFMLMPNCMKPARPFGVFSSRLFSALLESGMPFSLGCAIMSVFLKKSRNKMKMG
jgi:hypothetical protein